MLTTRLESPASISGDLAASRKSPLVEGEVEGLIDWVNCGSMSAAVPSRFVAPKLLSASFCTRQFWMDWKVSGTPASARLIEAELLPVPAAVEFCQTTELVRRISLAVVAAISE